MTERAFIDLIRQFKSAASRQHKSFAVGVNAVLALYREAVKARNLDVLDEARQIEWAGDVVMREYKPSDASYELPPTS